VDRLLADVDAIVASEDMQSLPASLEGTLAQLRETLKSVSTDSAMQERLLRTITEFDRTLKSLRDLLETLEEQPNALIFNREPGEDPRPPAGSQ
jgi:paraquat-inducible protein B